MKLFLLIWWNLVAGTPLKFHCCPTHGEEGVSRVLIYGKGQVRDRPLDGGRSTKKIFIQGKINQRSKENANTKSLGSM